jgi:hypothetical protein
MKISEFRKLIREEIQKVLKEAPEASDLYLVTQKNSSDYVLISKTPDRKKIASSTSSLRTGIAITHDLKSVNDIQSVTPLSVEQSKAILHYLSQKPDKMKELNSLGVTQMLVQKLPAVIRRNMA